MTKRQAVEALDNSMRDIMSRPDLPFGGKCKGILPLCVVLVINDNPYGLMFSLSLYEGIFHRYYLYSICWIQVWMP